MSMLQRLRYLLANFARNLDSSGTRLNLRPYSAARSSRTPVTASPGRALTESFLLTELPRLLGRHDIRVLEIGCGSGSLTRLLAESGYRGDYVGVDVFDRFDHSEQAEFRREFICSDAHDFQPEGQFDLIVSVSALEHIPDDQRLIRRLSTSVAPGGMQLHFVPSAWGLLTYLWHGYRQYSLPALGGRFDAACATAYAMGGGASLLLHVIFITFGEMLLGLRLRQRLPRFYGRLLDYCLRLDRLLPRCGTMYAVCQPRLAGSGMGNG
ncbi:Ubiquinone biosynthesis O-methyltransferase [Rhodocyclaceae bacterium]|nr:Ubiquinone biosynthesis O-methyltransferase [Rhodocyclaceae bacterium]